MFILIAVKKVIEQFEDCDSSYIFPYMRHWEVSSELTWSLWNSLSQHETEIEYIRSLKQMFNCIQAHT